MNRFQWTPDLATGNQFIDDDHHALIERIDSVLEAISKGRSNAVIAGTLPDLMAYTRGHFEREETEMDRVGYSDAPMHRAEHANLLRQVDELKAKFDAGQKNDPLALFNFLSHWLRHHILQVDTRLALAMKHHHDIE